MRLQVEVVGFSALAANADTSDCILMLNRIFSVFDQILDLHGVHKVSRCGLLSAGQSFYNSLRLFTHSLEGWESQHAGGLAHHV